MMIPDDSIMDREKENLRRIREIKSEIARESWRLRWRSDLLPDREKENLRRIREIQSETAREPWRLHRQGE